MRKKIVVASLVVVLLLAIVVIFGVLQSNSFRLLGTVPDINTVIPSSTSVLKLDFNKDLVQTGNNPTIAGKDMQIVAGLRIDKKTLFVDLKALDPDKTYIFAINNIQSKTGKQLKSLNIALKTKYTPVENIPVSQLQTEIQQDDRNNLNDPLLAYLPYQADSFYLESEVTNDDSGSTVLVINAQLFLTRDEVLQDRQVVLAKYKEEISNFIKSKNINPEKYYIRYTFNEPPMYESE